MKNQPSLFAWPPPLPERPKHRRPSPEEIASARAFFDELDRDLAEYIASRQPDLPFPEEPPAPELPALSLEERLDRTVKELGRHSIVELSREAAHRARSRPPILKGPIQE